MSTNVTPEEINRLIFEAGQRHNVDPRLLHSLMMAESGGNPNTPNSRAGAIGLMQIMPATARALGVDPRIPAQAIDGAARLLAQSLERHNDPTIALMEYHGGPNRNIWGPRTRSYPNQVLRHFNQSTFQPPTPPEPQAAAPAAATPAAAPVAAPAATEPAAQAMPDITGFLSGQEPPAPPVVNREPPAQATLSNGIGVDPPPPAGLDNFLSGTPEGPTRAPQTFGERFGAGFQRGTRDVYDRPAEWVASGADRVGLTDALRNSRLGQALQGAGVPIPTGTEQRDQNREDRNAFNELYGDSGAALGGRIAGNVAATIPIFRAAGHLLQGGARVAGALMPAGVTAAATPVAQGLANPSTVGNPLLRFGARAVQGGAQGGAGAALIADPDQPFAPQVAQGAAFGAGVNSTVMPALAATGRGIRDTVLPRVSRTDADLVNRARQLGIDVRGGQLAGTQSGFVRTLDSELNTIPLSGQAGHTAAQQNQWTRAVSRTFGEDVDQITPDVMNAARTRIGRMFDRVAQGTTIQFDPTLRGQLTQIGNDIRQVPLVRAEQRVLQRMHQNVLDSVQAGGRISGEAYQALTRRGAPLDLAQRSSDPNVRYFAGRIRSALDDALERHAPPNLAADLRTARNQWKAMRTVEPLVERGTGRDFVLSPQGLMERVRNSYDDYAYTGTNNDLGDLAQIGQRFLAQPPNSYTASRQAVRQALTVGGLGGTLASTGALFMDPGLAAVGFGVTGGSLAMGRGAGALTRSNWYRNALLRNAQTGRILPPIPGRAGAALGRYPMDPVNEIIRRGAVPATVSGSRQEWNPDPNARAPFYTPPEDRR